MARSPHWRSTAATGDDDDEGDEGDEELDDHVGEDGDSHGVYLGLDDSDYDEEPSRTR